MNLRNTIARIFVMMLAVGALLGACGQRGALFLPDEDRNVVVRPAPVAESATPMGSPVPAASPVEPASTDTTEEQRRSNPAPAK